MSISQKPDARPNDFDYVGQSTCPECGQATVFRLCTACAVARARAARELAAKAAP